jgi:hypothetical protein
MFGDNRNGELAICNGSTSGGNKNEDAAMPSKNGELAMPSKGMANTRAHQLQRCAPLKATIPSFRIRNLLFEIFLLSYNTLYNDCGMKRTLY